MFSQRKSFLKGKLFYIILFVLFAFGIWLNQAPVEQENPDEVSSTDKSYADTAYDESESGSYNIMDNIIGNHEAVSEGGVENTDTVSGPGDPDHSGYYLVKEIDGIIKIFYYDEEGKETLIRETDIAFSLLSIADQAFFQKGVIKRTSEELDELLQDFES